MKFAFTTVAMSAALEDTVVEYEDLADIERDFDDAETEIGMCLRCCGARRSHQRSRQPSRRHHS